MIKRVEIGPKRRNTRLVYLSFQQEETLRTLLLIAFLHETEWLQLKRWFYTRSAQMNPTKPSGKQQHSIAISAKQRWLSGRGMSRGGIWLYVE